MHTLIPIAVDKWKKETEFFAERERNKDESQGLKGQGFNAFPPF